jgi:hypothetical protein
VDRDEQINTERAGVAIHAELILQPFCSAIATPARGVTLHCSREF